MNKNLKNIFLNKNNIYIYQIRICRHPATLCCMHMCRQLCMYKCMHMCMCICMRMCSGARADACTQRISVQKQALAVACQGISVQKEANKQHVKQPALALACQSMSVQNQVNKQPSGDIRASTLTSQFLVVVCSRKMLEKQF